MAVPRQRRRRGLRGAGREGEFVVAGGQPAPVLDDVEGSFDDVAALVFLDVEADRAPASAAAASAVIDLGGLFGDDRADAPGAQTCPVCARRVGLIAQHRCRSTTRPTGAQTGYS